MLATPSIGQCEERYTTKLTAAHGECTVGGSVSSLDVRQSTAARHLGCAVTTAAALPTSRTQAYRMQAITLMMIAAACTSQDHEVSCTDHNKHTTHATAGTTSSPSDTSVPAPGPWVIHVRNMLKKQSAVSERQHRDIMIFKRILKPCSMHVNAGL